MSADHIRYDILVQQALRGMVRDVLAEAATKGLPGEHHFFVTFDTTAEGVQISDRLLERYPEEMTIVLQHQFWDMKVSDRHFEVGLSFSGVAEKLVVPLAAIKGFADPSVQFTLQFETLADTAANDADDEGEPEAAPQELPKRKPQGSAKKPAARTSVPASPPSAAETPRGDDGGGKSGAEVVRLDRFRKK